jgi:2,4-dienoyl-CoA reductase-like NADH-dependent reductase (Old Yellow Enzyme family)
LEDGECALSLAIDQELRLPCGVSIPNRLAKGAMTEGLATAKGVPTPELDRLYRIWSEGGAGLLITGNVVINPHHRERPGNVVLSANTDDNMRAALSRWTKAGTVEGNHMWMQINHAGRQTPKLINARPKAPSAVKLGLPGGQFGDPVALIEPEILDLVDRYAAAAKLARETGFTGVQVHAAHGYLLSSFLSPRANVRDDQWGGSLENRARFLMEVIKATRQAVGADFPVSVKLNSADFQKGGFAFDESIMVARWLQAAGVDLLEISGGSYEQPAMMDMQGLEAAERPQVAASTFAREAYFVDFAKAMKAEITMPIMVTGGFRSKAAIDHALTTGAADMIGLGRPLCSDPASAAKLLMGRATLDRPEDRLALLPDWLGPIKSMKMMRAIDGFAIQYWYYAQIYAIGKTGKPNPNLTVFSAWREVEKVHKALMAK